MYLTLKSSCMLFLFVFVFSQTAYGIRLNETTNSEGTLSCNSFVPTDFVNDYFNILSEGTKTDIKDRLMTIKRETTSEIAVVIIDSTKGASIEQCALDLFNAWSISDKDRSNGVLLLAAVNDRIVHIEVGLGLESVITNTIASAISDKMNPYFNINEFDKGLIVSITDLTSMLSHYFNDFAIVDAVSRNYDNTISWSQIYYNDHLFDLSKTINGDYIAIIGQAVVNTEYSSEIKCRNYTNRHFDKHGKLIKNDIVLDISSARIKHDLHDDNFCAGAEMLNQRVEDTWLHHGGDAYSQFISFFDKNGNLLSQLHQHLINAYELILKDNKHIVIFNDDIDLGGDYRCDSDLSKYSIDGTFVWKTSFNRCGATNLLELSNGMLAFGYSVNKNNRDRSAIYLDIYTIDGKLFTSKQLVSDDGFNDALYLVEYEKKLVLFYTNSIQYGIVVYDPSNQSITKNSFDNKLIDSYYSMIRSHISDDAITFISGDNLFRIDMNNYLLKVIPVRDPIIVNNNSNNDLIVGHFNLNEGWKITQYDKHGKIAKDILLTVDGVPLKFAIVDIVQADDGGFVVGGNNINMSVEQDIFQFITYGGGYWVAKLDKNGNCKQCEPIEVAVSANSGITDWDTSDYERIEMQYMQIVKYYNKEISDNDALRISRCVLYYSNHYRLDPRLIMAIIAIESAFEPKKINATENKYGIMQLTKEHASQLGVTHIMDVQQNIYGGIRYVRELYDSKSNLPNVLDYIIVAYYYRTNEKGIGKCEADKKCNDYAVKVKKLYKYFMYGE